MKAIEVSEYGGPEVLHLVDKDVPVPGVHQIVIENQAAGINFADLMSRAGNYPPAPKPPFVPGFEAAGVVSSVGDGVSHVKAGDRVAAMAQNGYAEFVLADAAGVIPIPDGLDYAQSVALLVQGGTAHLLLSMAVPTIKDKTVLVSAAAGGVGSLAVQIAKLLGAKTVIGLASTEDKRAFVRSLGADFALDYTKDGWADAVKQATNGSGADIFLDASGDMERGGLKAVAKSGHWVIYGSQLQGGKGIEANALFGMIGQGQTIRGFSLYEATPDVLKQTFAELFAWAANGQLTIETRDRFALSDAAKAHAAIASRQTSGKVTLEP